MTCKLSVLDLPKLAKIDIYTLNTISRCFSLMSRWWHWGGQNKRIFVVKTLRQHDVCYSVLMKARTSRRRRDSHLRHRNQSYRPRQGFPRSKTRCFCGPVEAFAIKPNKSRLQKQRQLNDCYWGAGRLFMDPHPPRSFIDMARAWPESAHIKQYRIQAE